MEQPKIILDLCAGSGAWSKPYSDAGYLVHLVTLPGEDVRTYTPPKEKIWGVLAAPPCERFSLANAQAPHWRDRDTDEALAIVLACIKIIWKVKPEWWALENPVGYLNRFLGRPGYTFRACDFGDPWEKRTYLWGWFNPPQRFRIQPTDLHHTTNGLVAGVHTAIAQAVIGRAARRAITPQGFVQAFFLANP